MADSMWDAALKGYSLGSKVGDDFSRRKANKRSDKLIEQLANDPKYKGDENEIARREAYDAGVADITRAARRRGLDIEKELGDRYTAQRDTAGVRKHGRQMLAVDNPIAPSADATIAPAASPLGAAPIAPRIGTGDDMGSAPAGAAASIAPATPAAGPATRSLPDYAGAAKTDAEFAYAGGHADAGDAAVKQGVRIGIGNDAMQRNKVTGQMEFDNARAAGGIRDDAARSGDLAGASQAQQLRGSGLQQQGQAFAGMALQELQQKEPQRDRVEATLNEMLRVQPQFGADRAIYDPAKKTITFMRGNVPTHEQSVATAADMEQVTGLLTQYTTNPDDFLKSHNDALLADAVAQKTEQGNFRKAAGEAMIEVAKEYAKNPAETVSNALSLIGKDAGGSKGKGFEVTKIDDAGGKILVQTAKGPVTLTSVTEDTPLPPDMKRVVGSMIVQKPNGDVTSFEEMNVDPEAGNKALQVWESVQRANRTNKDEDTRTALGFLSDIYQSLGNGRVSGSIGGGRGRTGPGAGSAGGGDNRADRNNNPGNIRDVGQFKGTAGYKGKDADGFAIFDSPEAGKQAHESQLARYMSGDTTGKPLTTVSDIVNTWSPGGGEGNTAESTQNYIASVSDALGVDPNAQLTTQDIPRLADAMAKFEGFTGGSSASQPSAMNRPSSASPADVQPKMTKNVTTETKPAGPTDAQKEAKATAAREAAARSPMTYRRNARDIRELSTNAKEAATKLRQFREDMRGHGTLTHDERQFEQRLMKAVHNTVDARDNAMSRGEDDLAFKDAIDKRGQSSAAASALEKKYGNPETDYVRGGSAAK